MFGQTGPRVGSFDAGFGSAYLARVVGEKRAREIWFLCRQYDAETAERWGLVNAVVPLAELRAEVRRWADEMLALSPTALRFLKQSFNVDTEHLAGVGQLAFTGLGLFVESEEAERGRARVHGEAPAGLLAVPGGVWPASAVSWLMIAPAIGERDAASGSPATVPLPRTTRARPLLALQRGVEADRQLGLGGPARQASRSAHRSTGGSAPARSRQSGRRTCSRGR